MGFLNLSKNNVGFVSVAISREEGNRITYLLLAEDALRDLLTIIPNQTSGCIQEIERFTVGRDREMDMYLAEADVLGSMAHITMLESIGLLEKDELQALLAELRNILAEIRAGKFVIEEGIEDVHSQVELMLTRRLGDVGKKIPTFGKAVSPALEPPRSSISTQCTCS